MLIAVITLFSIGMLSQASTVNSSTSTTNNHSSANATQPRVDVVVMACHANDEGTPAHIPFEVRASSSSTNAPNVESGSNCAQALADLLSAGFTIEDVQPWPINGVGAYYTLVRTTEGQTGNPGNNSTAGEQKASANAVAVARHFLLSKLPALGIQIENELDLHTDMVVAETESEYSVDFSVIDHNGNSHDGRVEISNGEVMFAEMDGKSIL